MLTIMIYIKIFFLAWVITKFEPIEMILELLPDKLFYNVIRLVFSCLMCCLFWTTFALTGNIFAASFMAYIGFWYNKFISPIENKVRL